MNNIYVLKRTIKLPNGKEVPSYLKSVGLFVEETGVVDFARQFTSKARASEAAKALAQCRHHYNVVNIDKEA